MKKIITFILLISFFTVCSQNQSRDVLFLKNGSIIKGSIIEMNPTTSIKIKTADGSLFVYKMEEILKTEKEEITTKQEPIQESSGVSQLDLENVFRPYLLKNRSDLEFIGITKVNGIKRTFYGQQIYEIEYELLIETTTDIYISLGNSSNDVVNSGDFLLDFSYAVESTPGTRLLEKGKRVLFTGAVGFEETDNGWRNGDFIPENYKIVASDYLTPEIRKRQAEEKAIAIALLKKELDWQQPDAAPVSFVSKHLKTDNVPLFGKTYSKYTLKKSSDYSGRNEVLNEIQQMFYSAIANTYRHTEIEAEVYNSSQNKEIAEFSIQNAVFEFIETGYQCKIYLKASINGTYTEPKDLPFRYSLTIPGVSKSYAKKMSKREAFASALTDLKSNVSSFVLKYKPIRLELQKIVTNKRGKADQVIFKKPELFIATQRIKFEVLNANHLSIAPGTSMSFTNSIGECLFKGEIIGDTIICEIRGSKNKKEFIKYLENTDALIGISKY
ncbi:hypothetical protein [Lacinutrix sp. MEBiC02595]